MEAGNMLGKKEATQQGHALVEMRARTHLSQVAQACRITGGAFRLRALQIQGLFQQRENLKFLRSEEYGSGCSLKACVEEGKLQRSV